MAESVSFFSDQDPGGQLFTLREDYLNDPVYTLSEDVPPSESGPSPEASGDNPAARNGA